MLDNIRKYHSGGQNNRLIIRALLIIFVVLMGFLLIYRLIGRL